mmetsp:Transcript_45641/g.75882  ORF Transcript_45641/g.75882 Transcript_45641/m.75882 type:complete len:244 (+) Transcript_45641:1884-2615(+)
MSPNPMVIIGHTRVDFGLFHVRDVGFSCAHDHGHDPDRDPAHDDSCACCVLFCFYVHDSAIYSTYVNHYSSVAVRCVNATIYQICAAYCSVAAAAGSSGRARCPVLHPSKSPLRRPCTRLPRRACCRPRPALLHALVCSSKRRAQCRRHPCHQYRRGNPCLCVCVYFDCQRSRHRPSFVGRCRYERCRSNSLRPTVPGSHSWRQHWHKSSSHHSDSTSAQNASYCWHYWQRQPLADADLRRGF